MPRSLVLLLLSMVLSVALFSLAPTRAQTQAPAGVPPQVVLFTQDGGGRELRAAINNDATGVEVQHYAATDDPAGAPRHRCLFPVTGYGSYRGDTVICWHIYGDAAPDDRYYILESGYDGPRRWGPYRLTQAPTPQLLDGPQPHVVYVPTLQP